MDAYNFANESIGNHLLRMGKVTTDDLDEMKGCGLRMVVQSPAEFPQDLLDMDLETDDLFQQLNLRVLEEAIRRWNNRK